MHSTEHTQSCHGVQSQKQSMGYALKRIRYDSDIASPLCRGGGDESGFGHHMAAYYRTVRE